MINFNVQSNQEFRSGLTEIIPKVQFLSDDKRNEFRDMVFNVQGTILKYLKLKWRENDDFCVGWDFDYQRFTCGGIYSEKIFCRDYINTIGFALSDVDKDGVWVYHTVCEILINPNGKTMGECTEDRGEFYNIGDQCYINGDSMNAKWRQVIGCLK